MQRPPAPNLTGILAPLQHVLTTNSVQFVIPTYLMSDAELASEVEKYRQSKKEITKPRQDEGFQTIHIHHVIIFPNLTFVGC
jgi:hypothetical protein